MVSSVVTSRCVVWSPVRWPDLWDENWEHFLNCPLKPLAFLCPQSESIDLAKVSFLVFKWRQNSESGYCPWTSGTSRHPSVVGACVYLRTVDTLVLRDWFVLWGHKWSCLVQVILLSVFCVQYMFCLSWLGYNGCKLISHWQRCKLWIALKNGHCWVNCFWSHFSLSLSSCA